MIARIKVLFRRKKRSKYEKGDREGKYGLFVSTTKRIYFMDVSDVPDDAHFERWAANEKDTYGDTVLNVYQVKIIKHHEAVLGEPEDRRFPRFQTGEQNL